MPNHQVIESRKAVSVIISGFLVLVFLGNTVAFTKSASRMMGSTNLFRESIVNFRSSENHHPDLKIFDHNELLEYYNETKGFLNLPNEPVGDDAGCGAGCGERSVLDKTKRSNDNLTFWLQNMEPRHRKSMMRCVLNNSGNNSLAAGSRRQSLVSKSDFQYHLQCVEQRRRWNMTHQLLFGDEVEGVWGPREGEARERALWWESGFIQDELTPQFLSNVQKFRWYGSVVNANSKTLEKTPDDPKKFLSRLARGRKYKGNFRSLLEDYVATTNRTTDNPHGDDLISIYDQIVAGSSKCKTKPRDEKYELNLLRSFVDELENASRKHSGDNGKDRCYTDSSVIVNSEQIDLLRNICDLNIFSSSSMNAKHTVLYDNGLSIGRRGERDLEAFLREKLLSSSCSKNVSVSESPFVVSPVWVRPKYKNRKSCKQKCRYVLEIPNLSRDDTMNSIPLGTTSEFDAMVVRFIETTGIDSSAEVVNQELLTKSPIMLIQEVWDAKATLDPAALLDILEKKAGSLQKLLFNENYSVATLDTSYNEVNTKDVETRKCKIEDITFTIINGEENSGSPSSSPLVSRVAVELAFNGIQNAKCGSEGSPSMRPRVGIFASRQILPRAAAKRIETIVYEQLLERNLEIVKAVLHSCNSKDRDLDNSVDHSRINELVFENSMKMIDRIVESINVVKPLVVVGTMDPQRHEFEQPNRKE